MRIPVRRGYRTGTDRRGLIFAHALVSSADAYLAQYSWTFDTGGYVMRRGVVDGRLTSVMMAREVMGLRLGDPREVDHWNGDKLDNRRGNLRFCTRSQNMQNVDSCRGSTSSYRGVSWHGEKGKWQANATVNGKQHYLGAFEGEEEAARVAAAFRAEHMPFSRDAA